jgi:hypothetical protein
MQVAIFGGVPCVYLVYDTNDNANVLLGPKFKWPLEPVVLQEDYEPSSELGVGF